LPKLELSELTTTRRETTESSTTYEGTPFEKTPEEVRLQAQAQQAEEDEEAFVLESPDWQETRLAEEEVEEVPIEAERNREEKVSATTHNLVEEVAPPDAEEQADEERPVVAEYEFEDEVIPEQAGDLPDQVGDLSEQGMEAPTKAKSVGPKLSVSGKVVQDEEPIKLSALLGDSRPMREPHRESSSAAKEEPHRESSSAVKAEQLHESSSAVAMDEVDETIVDTKSEMKADDLELVEMQVQKVEQSDYDFHESSSSQGKSAIIYTSPMGNVKNNDSIWNDMLLGDSGKKATLKFRIVQADDNIHDLAERYNTSVHDLLRVNNLQNQTLEEGQILYIPAAKR
jgi:stage VI sporulation protein D